MLLGPADFRRCEGSVPFGSRRDDVTLLIEDQSARASGSDINAQGVDDVSPLLLAMTIDRLW